MRLHDASSASLPTHASAHDQTFDGVCNRLRRSAIASMTPSDTTRSSMHVRRKFSHDCVWAFVRRCGAS